MTPTPKLRLVALGSAKALTRDMIEGPYTELGVFPSSKPAG
jgi:hypothetical protein